MRHDRHRHRLLVVAAVLGFCALLPGSASTTWHEGAPGFGGDLRDLTIRKNLRPAPRYQVTGPNGATELFRHFEGRLVLLNFWATWCPPCVEEMPSLDRLEARLGGPRFEVVTLSLDRTKDGLIDAFFEQHGLEHLRIYWDHQGKAPVTYRVGVLPTTLIIGPDGNIVATLAGPARWDSDEALELISHFLDHMDSPGG